MSVEVTTLLQTTVNSLGQPIAWPREGVPEMTALLIEMAPGDSTGWHRHPVPLMGYILSGELTVRQSSGQMRVVRAGEVSLEAVESIHAGSNEGSEPVRMVVFVAGVKGLPFTVAEG